MHERLFLGGATLVENGLDTEGLFPVVGDKEPLNPVFDKTIYTNGHREEPVTRQFKEVTVAQLKQAPVTVDLRPTFVSTEPALRTYGE